MLDLAELASREPWWTTKNGNSVAHVEITLDERDAILRLVKERDALRAALVEARKWGESCRELVSEGYMRGFLKKIDAALTLHREGE